MALRSRNLNQAKGMAEEAALLKQGVRAEYQYRLRIDRQTKESYETGKAAEQAALAIKKAHPILFVEVFDAQAGESKVIELSK
jgi:hypothetical protein